MQQKVIVTISVMVMFIMTVFATRLHVEEPGVSVTTDDEPQSDSTADLGRVLEPILKKHSLPALAAAVIVEGRVIGLGAVGVRKVGSEVKVTTEDKFHIGSCTKAMTASLIAILIEQGKLQWNMTLAEAFPDLAKDMHPAYRGVTMKHLLAHRAGLPPNLPQGRLLLDLHRLPGSARQQRSAYVRMMLIQSPEAEPGTKYIYSNAGYSIAGAIAERVTDTSWEELMEQMLFRPLSMKTTGFGAMGAPGKIEQPWQHRVVNGKAIPVPPGPLSDNPPVLGPAGRVHCSIGDWSRFVIAHIKGARGEKSFLTPETFKILHTPGFGGEYASGWIVTERRWGGGRVLTHAGSNTMNFAVVWMAPNRNFAVLVVTNQGGDVARKACDETAGALITKYLLKEE